MRRASQTRAALPKLLPLLWALLLAAAQSWGQDAPKFPTSGPQPDQEPLPTGTIVVVQPPVTLDQNCVVAILNRVTRVQPDGTWALQNVPTGFGLVRARATCVNNGVTRNGQSDPFLVPANGIVTVSDIKFDAL